MKYYKVNQIKLSPDQKVNQINIRRLLLTTHHKNKWVINARQCLKNIEDCNNINNQARKMKSIKSVTQAKT